MGKTQKGTRETERGTGAERGRTDRREPWILLFLGGALLVFSGIRPHDQLTWLEEVGPILIGVPILMATYRRMPLTPLVYRLLFLHAVILMIGGHYTYARVPLGDWVRDAFHLARNHYDRLGHLAQGFVPAILAREILLRRSPLVRGKWLFFLVVCVCATISVFYEFIEWWTALISGDGATDFLGTQGDPWDTQWDMFLCTAGALLAQLTLSRCHDRQLEAMPGRERARSTRQDGAAKARSLP
jgi:putative membrane protein